MDSLAYYAETDADLYFSPDTEVHVYDPDEEEWNELRKTVHSLDSLLAAVNDATLPSEHVRIVPQEAERYLDNMHDGRVDRELHDDPLMTRSRLVALVEADYTSTHDLLASDDPLDISRDTGIDRDVLQTIAARYATGFSTANATETGELADLSPRDDFDGWTLAVHSPRGNLIRWTTKGRFNLTLKTGHGISLACNAPNPDRHAWYRKGRTVEFDADPDLAPEQALHEAHEWLDAHQLTLEDDLAQLPHVGLATQDYLNLAYEIATYDDLREFAHANKTEFTAIFGTHADTVRDALDDRA